MENNRSSLLIGIIITLVGGIILFNNLGIIDVTPGEIINTYWPLLLILWGLDRLLFKKNKTTGGQNIISLLILIIGIIILGRNMGYYNIDLSLFWKSIWPILIILFGISLLRGAGKTNGSGVAFMSGIDQKHNNWPLESKSYLALMGGIELDLTVADIPDEEIYLDLTAVMGGIEIKAPENLNVTCTGTAILGGIDFFKEGSGGILVNRTFKHKGEDTSKQITIGCRAIMGGIEIKGV